MGLWNRLRLAAGRANGKDLCKEGHDALIAKFDEFQKLATEIFGEESVTIKQQPVFIKVIDELSFRFTLDQEAINQLHPQIRPIAKRISSLTGMEQTTNSNGKSDSIFSEMFHACTLGSDLTTENIWRIATIAEINNEQNKINIEDITLLIANLTKNKDEIKGLVRELKELEASVTNPTPDPFASDRDGKVKVTEKPTKPPGKTA